MKTSLCIRNNEGESIDMNRVQELATNNNIQVSKTNVKDNGDVYVELPSAEREKLVPLLEEEAPNEVVRLKGKLPTVTVLGVQNFASKEDFVDKVKKQNLRVKELIDKGSEFDVVFSKPPRENAPVGKKYYQVVIRVGDDIRRALKAADDKIFMDLRVHQVVDRFYIKRCNKCQQFGHYEKDCKNTAHQCAYCQHQHKSSECDQVDEGDFENYDCHNCRKAQKDSAGHSTFWYKCPTMLEQQKKVKKGIPYYQKN